MIFFILALIRIRKNYSGSRKKVPDPTGFGFTTLLSMNLHHRRMLNTGMYRYQMNFLNYLRLQYTVGAQVR